LALKTTFVVIQDINFFTETNEARKFVGKLVVGNAEVSTTRLRVLAQLAGSTLGAIDSFSHTT